MRKRFSIILAVVLSAVCLMPTMSSAYYYGLGDDDSICSDSEMKIIDTATSYLNEDGFQLYIILGKEAAGFDEQAAADAEAEASDAAAGIVAYINATEGEAAISAVGSASGTFTEDVCDAIESIAEDKCKTTSYFDACQSIVVNVENTIDGKSLVSGDFYRPAVTDEAGYLSDSEAAALEERFDGIRQQYGVDVAVYTETKMSTVTAEAAADDIFDYHLYGAGADDSGILLYVAKEDRKYQFTTYADAQRIFGDNEIDELCDLVVPYLSDGDYYGAFMAYADGAEAVLSGSGVPGKSKNIPLVAVEALAIGAVIGLLAAAIMTSARKREMDTALEAADADEYVKDGSMVLTGQRDIFLYSTVARTKKPESNSSHSSSSGRSHGGGGGSF